MPWRGCPDHGAMLRRQEGHEECRVAHCDRSWPLGWMTQSCPEPATHALHSPGWDRVVMICGTHAWVARGTLVDKPTIYPVQ